MFTPYRPMVPVYDNDKIEDHVHGRGEGGGGRDKRLGQMLLLPCDFHLLVTRVQFSV